jgi:hypothetical protein
MRKTRENKEVFTRSARLNPALLLFVCLASSVYCAAQQRIGGTVTDKRTRPKLLDEAEAATVGTIETRHLERLPAAQTFGWPSPFLSANAPPPVGTSAYCGRRFLTKYSLPCFRGRSKFSPDDPHTTFRTEGSGVPACV